jgi:hypothetical protein
MRSFSLFVGVMVVALTSLIGCAGHGEVAAQGTGGTDVAVTEAAPSLPAPPTSTDAAKDPSLDPTPASSGWDRLVGKTSTTYKSGGTSACGHLLTLTRGMELGKGSYDYRFTPCRSDGTPELLVGTKSGEFEVRGSTLELKPGGPTFRITKTEAEMDVPGSDLVIENIVDGAQLVAEGLVE